MSLLSVIHTNEYNGIQHCWTGYSELPVLHSATTTDSQYIICNTNNILLQLFLAFYFLAPKTFPNNNCIDFEFKRFIDRRQEKWCRVRHCDIGLWQVACCSAYDASNNSFLLSLFRLRAPHNWDIIDIYLQRIGENVHNFPSTFVIGSFVTFHPAIFRIVKNWKEWIRRMDSCIEAYSPFIRI